MSTNLTRRLTALEQIAEDVRRREDDQKLLELATERGIDVDRLREADERCRARTARLRAQGLTDGQITEAIARGMGIGPDELKARRAAIMERFRGDDRRR